MKTLDLAPIGALSLTLKGLPTMAKTPTTKSQTNGTHAPTTPFPAPAAAAPPPPPPAPAAAPPVDPAAAFARYVRGLTGDRLLAMIEHDSALRVALGKSWNDHETLKGQLASEIKALQSKARALGVDLPGAPKPARAPSAKPRASTAAANPEHVAKFEADLRANPGSKAVEAIARTGLTKEEWSAARQALGDKVAKKGTKGPQVSYSMA